MPDSKERHRSIMAGLERAAEMRSANQAAQANKGSKDVKPNRLGVVELNEADVIASGNGTGRDFSGILDEDVDDKKTE